MTKRNAELFDIAPFSRIYFGDEDMQDFYKTMDLNQKNILENIQDAYYFDIPSFNPRAAKDEFTVAVLSIVRYFLLAKKEKETGLSVTYLAFSGKFYSSIHSGSFPVVQPSEYRHIIEYVVNHELSNRFDIEKAEDILAKMDGNDKESFLKDKAQIEKLECDQYVHEKYIALVDKAIKNIDERKEDYRNSIIALIIFLAIGGYFFFKIGIILKIIIILLVVSSINAFLGYVS